jgi:serine/threonine protein kinase/formylglycine-generating enzyme required for sulfatase activity
MPSYSDILFGKIVVKNGLAPLAAVQECLQIQETSRQRGVLMTLPEVLVARAAISEEQARLASRAQALTQLQRSESIYAKICHERSLVPFAVLQDCFAEQKKRRFSVRISQLLIERNLITAEQNEEVMEEQLVRLGEETRQQEEAGILGSTQLQDDSGVRKLQAEQSQIQNLEASTLQKARFGPATSAAARPGPARAGAPPPPLAPTPPPRKAPRPPTPSPDEESDGRTIQLDVDPVFAGDAAAPIPVKELKALGPRSTADARPQKQESADPTNLIGKTISSRYKILEKLGEGGMGTVYKAEHCLMEKIVAFKVLHPHLIANKESLERFRREVRAASKFQHKNVIQIYDAGEGEGGIFYMAMEFVEGTSLESILQKGLIPFERQLVILRQVLKAVGEAHKKGIVHRDLKSDNIMLTRDKRGEDLIKVMDFGIAKVLEGDTSHAESADGERVYKTMEGVITGTPQYMSPEQCEGKKVDARSDLYSLGIIMFEMLTGRLPFESETAMGFIGKHIVEEPALPSKVRPDLGIDPAYEKIVMKLLEKSPDARYQSAGDIFTDLEEKVTNKFLDVKIASGSVSGEQVKPKQSGANSKETAAAPKSPALILALVLFLALGVVGLGLTAAIVFKKPDKPRVVEEALAEIDQLKKDGKIKEALARVRSALSVAPDDASLLAVEKELEKTAPPVSPPPPPAPPVTTPPPAPPVTTPPPAPPVTTPPPAPPVTPPPAPPATTPPAAPTAPPAVPPPTPTPPAEPPPPPVAPPAVTPPSPPPSGTSATNDEGAKKKSFAAALDRAKSAMAPGLDLETAKTALEEAQGLASGLGDEAAHRLADRKAALAALVDLRPRIDATRDELTLLGKSPKDAKPEQLAAARTQIDDGAKVLAGLADVEVAQALDPRLQELRKLADLVQEAMPKPDAVDDDAVSRWREALRRFKEEQLPDLEPKRDGASITNLLAGLKANPAWKNVAPDERTWVREALDRYTLRQKAWSKIPARFVSIKGGAYTMARAQGRSDAPAPAGATVTLKDYAIDSQETPQLEYAKFLHALASADDPPETPPDFSGGNEPVANVSAKAAVRYATWLTKQTEGLVEFRLPTEAEWERAARGTAGNDFPWGTTYQPDRDSHRIALGERHTCRDFAANDMGIFDMAGNVAEFTSTVESSQRVVKGGSWISKPEVCAASARQMTDPDEKNPYTGFRLVAIETAPKK